MQRKLDEMLNQLERELYKKKDYIVLFPRLSSQISSWISLNAPHLELGNPVRAIELALKQIEFSLDFSDTERLVGILGEDFRDKLQYWSKLGIVLSATYTFNTECICEIKHYSFNDRLGFAQWKKHIKDNDLQLRLTFGEPLIDVFKEWRERRVKDIEGRYNEKLYELAVLLKNEFDNDFLKILDKCFS
ncbi:hypothetical protein [Priestia megaterium]|uniref:Uncharacterized protein n=1 Tax=Priestia megaterium TaxID=1404 RepID=A0A6M6E1I5_PRIMG|nr:hypothetical protein [Priestia megaterium]QJX80911.1 hypothetical protein FDZ14_33000 [Priestia megaterium]